MTFNHGLGWRADREDRAYLWRGGARFSLSLPFTAPEEIDPRPWLAIEDQGQVGSCSGHAMSSCLEVLNWFDTRGQEIQLSRMFAYLIAQKVDGLLGRDNGATISGAVEAAKLFGICKEETFPYPGRYVVTIPAGAEQEAAEHKLLQHSKLIDYMECFDWLASGTGAIEIGIPWRESLANAGGVIERASGQNYGGHALAIVGYTGRRDSQGRQYLIMANSHGRGWGDNGFAEIAPRLFDQWGRDEFCEMIGMTDLEEFAPRKLDWIGGMMR